MPCPGLNEESHPCVLHGASTLLSKLGCLDVEEDMALPDVDFWDTPVEIDMLNPKNRGLDDDFRVEFGDFKIPR